MGAPRVLCSQGVDVPITMPSGPASDYHYTSQGGATSIHGLDDLAEFRVTQEALKLLCFTEQQQRQLLQVLAAILNLGNVEMGVAHRGGEEVGAVAPKDQWLHKAARLLGLDQTALQKWLTHKKIATVYETIIKPLTHSQVRRSHRYRAHDHHMVQV